MMIYEKIISAFSKMDGDHYGSIFQFCTPVTIGGKHLLSTFGHPFAVDDLGSSFKKYRRLCVDLVYDIDVNSSNSSKFRGTPASAFLNRIPEISSIDEVDPLLRNAFQECDFRSSVMIPICFPSQTSSSSDFIGVIECSSWINDGAHSFVNMKIKEEGLSVYTVQDRIPYKAINGLKLATDQIQEALKIVCQSHHIPLAQVWIASLDENHVHFSSSLEDAQTRRLSGLKLTSYISVGEGLNFHYWFFQYYYDACDMILLHPGGELILKTLQDSQPRFCKNISQLGTYKIMGCTSPFDGTRSLTICMRSILTSDFNYVFEFLWEHCPSHPLSLEIILFDIQRCLPSFKFASDTETRDRLHVIDVGNSTDKEIKKLDIFQAKRLSPIPEALKEGRNKWLWIT